jgi:hypothetical protein
MHTPRTDERRHFQQIFSDAGRPLCEPPELTGSEKALSATRKKVADDAGHVFAGQLAEKEKS